LKTIFFFGYYGFKNTGDDSVLQSLLTDLTEHSDFEFLVASDDLIQTEELYRQFNVTAIPWDNYALINLAILKSDLLVIGGGGLYNSFLDYREELFLRGGHRYFSVATFGLPYLAELWNTPCMICGVGASKVLSEAAKVHIGGGLQRCSAVTVRDTASKRILNSFPGAEYSKILVGADPVFRLSPDYEKLDLIQKKQIEVLSDKKKPVLGVSLRNWSFRGNKESIIENVAKAVNDFVLKTGGTVVFLQFDNGGAVKELSEDSAIFEKVKAKLHPEVQSFMPEGYLTPNNAISIVKECDYIIGMRFHAVVMALNQGIPLIALAYEEKVWSAMDLCNMNEWCIDVNDIDGPNVLSQYLSRLIEKSEKVKVTISEYADKCRRSASLHSSKILELLEKGHAKKDIIEADPVKRMLKDSLLDSLEGNLSDEKCRAFETGDYHRALSLLELKHNAKNARDLYEEAFCLHQLRRNEEALDYYQKALDSGFDEFWVRYNRGQLHITIGNNDEAIKDLRKAYELSESEEKRMIIADILKLII
jgi:polysaccharide pyruvyl transferase WcaK-like protein